jgi:hypothetical protein
VGETWLPKLRDAGGVPMGQSMAGGVTDSEGKADVPLLKLFEFLTASLCLYVIEEESTSCPLRRKANVYSAGKLANTNGWVWRCMPHLCAQGHSLRQRSLQSTRAS